MACCEQIPSHNPADFGRVAIESAGRIFFYPPILFVAGVVAAFNGISYKLNR